MKIVSADEFLLEQDNSKGTGEQDRVLDDAVLEIIREVRNNGDEAVRTYTKAFDDVTLGDFVVSEAEFQEAEQLVDDSFKSAIKRAMANIQRFHENQAEKSWFMTESNGVFLGQKVTPIDRVGIYIPGGTAAYPSSVLMNAVPAKIAGVPDIVMTTPPQANGKVNPGVLIAAKAVGVETVYKVGGAQAVAALAYGTESIQQVSKIVGPGNAYVACAKKWVYGDVDIDMIAGPSEICVVADETANVAYVAADLLSQAEHDERAVALCITTSRSFAKDLQQEVGDQTKSLNRVEIIEQSLKANGRIIVADTLDQAFDLVNELAPEHLQLMIEDPMEHLETVRHAGAIFLGNYSPEALGDYVAGPNHTLPTSGTAKFSSPLGVYDFVKRSSVIHYSKEALHDVANEIMTLAEAEGLDAHAKSIQKREEDFT